MPTQISRLTSVQYAIDFVINDHLRNMVEQLFGDQASDFKVVVRDYWSPELRRMEISGPPPLIDSFKAELAARAELSRLANAETVLRA